MDMVSQSTRRAVGRTAWRRRRSLPTKSERRQVAIDEVVSIVDDDVSVRESLPDLLRSFGLGVEAFASAEAFVASEYLDRTRCLILDVAMPGMTGPELQEELIRRHHEFPIVFITARCGDRIVPRVLERGAVACLLKPLNAAELVEAVNAALKKEERARREQRGPASC